MIGKLKRLVHKLDMRMNPEVVFSSPITMKVNDIVEIEVSREGYKPNKITRNGKVVWKKEEEC